MGINFFEAEIDEIMYFTPRNTLFIVQMAERGK